MRKRTVAFVVLMITAAFAYLAGCSGGGGSADKGTLKLSITDKQSEEFDKLVIAVREIRVVPTGREDANDDDTNLPVLARFTTPKVIDIMQLQFIQEALGEIALPVGSYSQIRLILQPNPSGNQDPVNYLTLKTAPTVKIELTTPSGQQSGLKIKGPVQVKPGVINVVMIDFDPNTAVVSRGNSGGYNFKPTGIRLIETSDMTLFGSMVGNVSSTFKDWSSATVSIKRRGSVNDADPIAAGRIFSSYTSGSWQAPFSAFVPPTTESVSYKAFIAANGFRLYSSPTVTVNQGQATDLGAIGLEP